MSVGTGPFNFRLYPIITQAKDILELVEYFFDIKFKPHFSISYRDKVLIQSLNSYLDYKTECYGPNLRFNCVVSSQRISTQNYLYVLHKSLIFQFDVPFLSTIKILDENISSVGLFLHKTGENTLVISPNKDLQEQNTIDLNNLERFGEDWLKNEPKTNRYLNSGLWDYSWLLQRMNTIPALSPFQYDLIIPSRISMNNEIDLINSQSIQMIDDLMWFRGDIAIQQLENFFKLYRDSDAMVANRAYIDRKNPQNNEVKFDYHVSQLPVWSYMLLELSKFLGNSDILLQYYNLCCRNMEWWEKNRFYPDYGLFGAKLPASLMGIEMNMPASPRFFTQFNGRAWTSIPEDHPREMLLIDLNAQMADYYQNLGVIGSMVGDENASTYFQKAEQIQDRAQELLWDEKTKFYYDFDLEMQTLQPLKTSAAFWALFGGLVSKGKINDVCMHLTNPTEFGTEFPYPAVSSDYPNFNKEVWNGTVCLSQHYWLLVGLKRYGMTEFISKIIEKVFRYLNDSFGLYGSVYEFYPSMSYNVQSIKGGHINNFKNRPDYLGHNVIHSLFYRGLLGGEILDDSISFIPDWNIFSKDINYSLFYRNKKMDAYMSKMKNKMIEFLSEQ